MGETCEGGCGVNLGQEKTGKGISTTCGIFLTNLQLGQRAAGEPQWGGYRETAKYLLIFFIPPKKEFLLTKNKMVNNDLDIKNSNRGKSIHLIGLQDEGESRKLNPQTMRPQAC